MWRGGGNLKGEAIGVRWSRGSGKWVFILVFRPFRVGLVVVEPFVFSHFRF